MLRPLFTKNFIPAWLGITTLAGCLAIPRFYWMLHGDYNSVVWIFLFLWILPFLLLSASGRRSIGMTKPIGAGALLRLLFAFCIGALTAIAIGAIGNHLYGTSTLNWYETIKLTLMQRGDMIAAVNANPSLFVAFVLPAMMFSPIGEEFFFRGILHELLLERFGNTAALCIDAAIFGLTHLAHYGLVLQDGYLTILLPSAFWWVLLMAGIALLFSFARHYASTLWAAVLCHAGFNLAMMGYIFFG